jgi:hypothetical protein
MKLLQLLFRLPKSVRRPRLMYGDHRQEQLVKVGREQFKKLLEKGLSVPVVLL